MLYPLGHPYRYLTIGKHEDLLAASVDDVKGFFKTWYVPANATIAIVGDIDLAATKKLVAKYFASFPTSTKPSVVAIPAPAITGSRAQTTTVEDPFAKQQRIQFAWHTPAAYKDGDAELEVLASALDIEGPGRLYKTLVYDKQLATAVSAGQDQRQFSSIFRISVTLRTGADLEEVKKLVAEELARVTRDPISDKELARAIAREEASMIYGLETPIARAQQLQSYNHFVGDPDKITWDLDRYRHTTTAKIRDVAAKYLRPDAMVTTITMPKDGAK
jgi:predicted Zn-dependent peptidase